MGHRRQVAYHDAAFAVIPRALNVAIRPPAQRCGLRLFKGDVFTAWEGPNSAEDLEQMAVVAMAGHIALDGLPGRCAGRPRRAHGQGSGLCRALRALRARAAARLRPQLYPDPRHRTDHRSRASDRQTLAGDPGRSRPAPRRSPTPSRLTSQRSCAMEVVKPETCTLLAERRGTSPSCATGTRPPALLQPQHQFYRPRSANGQQPSHPSTPCIGRLHRSRPIVRT